MPRYPQTPYPEQSLTWAQANGGTVSRLEKDADYLIADHAKLNLAPAGSLSWKFIQESVEKGELADAEFHRIGRHPGVARPAGSAEPTRKTRTRFTAEDDALLTSWVRNEARASQDTEKGNKLYQRLEILVNRVLNPSYGLYKLT